MKNKKSGFVSMALVYTFLIVFLFLMLAILRTYLEKDKYLEAINSQIEEDINKNKQSRSLILSKVLEDNTPQSYDMINFIFPANNSIGNGNGLFYIDDISITDEDNDGSSNRIYFFRGEVNNNHLILNNICFRILRTNEDGTIRIVYDGMAVNNTCKDISQKPNVGIEETNFSDYNSFSLVEEVDGFVPLYDDSNTMSKVINILNNWYLDNIISTNVSDKVSKYTIFCNNKVYLSNDSNYYYYMAKNMVPKLINPNNNNYHDLSNVTSSFSLVCSRMQDRYSAIDRTLKYPVGLLSAEDILLAGGYLTDSTDAFNGGENGKVNTKFYLYNSSSYWTSSAFMEDADERRSMVGFSSNGFMEPMHSYISSAYVIPVISLNADIKITSGNGTASLPYIVE